jgi:multidrug efflux pump
MMAARILKHKPEHEQGRFYHWSESVFNKTIEKYGDMLRVVLRHQPLTIFVAAATLAATVVLFIIIPKGFFPVQDTGVILGISEAPQSISFPALVTKQQELAKVVLQDKAVQAVASFVGVDGVNLTPNNGRIQITLKPLAERDASASEIIRRLQPEVAKVAGIDLYMQAVQDLSVENRVTRTQYQYTLEAPTQAELNNWVPRLLDRMKQIPHLTDVASDQLTGGLGLELNIDRDTAARFGITPQNIDDTLYDAFGQRQVSTIFTQLNQYHVVLESRPQWQTTIDALKDLRVKTSTGVQAPLETFTTVRQVTVPLTINHQGQFPAVTLSFNLAPRASLGAAVDEIRAAAKDIGIPLSVETSFQGAAAAFENSLANETSLILAALITVYIVLGVLYESYIHPITILSTLPSAGVGALLALLICHEDFGIIALIGIILLIGIVKKNAIMMIDFALEAERVEGKTPEEAIYQACLLRFRPIMMTTMAALLGGVPLAFGTGMGSELRRPLGITIIGGLIFSQILTLFTTPVIYLAFDRIARWFAKRKDTETEQLSLPEMT